MLLTQSSIQLFLINVEASTLVVVVAVVLSLPLSLSLLFYIVHSSLSSLPDAHWIVFFSLGLVF